MKFQKHILFFLLVLCSLKHVAQFKFSGEVNSDFSHSKVYLNVIDNYKQNGLFLTEKIISESAIDSAGNFSFKGDFLSKENKFYKIYIDKCSNNIADYNHLLNHCDESNYIVFIANNNDYIHFPLNELDQMFCSYRFSSPQNTVIQKIDSVQETLLIDLQDSKNDHQRKLIYANYFKELQNYSKSFNEPLAELYSFNLYSDDQSFSRSFYISDLKNSNYYSDLLERLQVTYPNSNYTQQYKDDLNRDRITHKNKTIDTTVVSLVVLLIFSIIVNIYLIRKKRKRKSKIDYKEVLSPQELKVFDLMIQGLSNKEIADQLFISISTVKSHINNLYAKLSISSRGELSLFLKK